MKTNRTGKSHKKVIDGLDRKKRNKAKKIKDIMTIILKATHQKNISFPIIMGSNTKNKITINNKKK